MEERLIIKEMIDSPLAVSSEKGKPIYERLQKNINNNIFTIIDFSGIKSLTTAFLNVAIGELYRTGTSKNLNKQVKIDTSTLTPSQFKKIKLVMENSKTKYNKGLKKNIDEVTLYGESH